MLEEFIKYIKSLEASVIKLQKDLLNLTTISDFNKNKVDQLEKKIIALETKGETPIDCAKIDWDSTKFVKEAIGGKTVYTLKTKNTGTKKVEFKSDTQAWTTGKLTFSNTGKCENVWFRVEGCTKEIWGCVNTFPTVKSVDFVTDVAKTIQLQVYQNCSNNDGVHFRAEVMYPDTDTKSYTFDVINTGTLQDAIVEKLTHNTWVIRNHDNKKNGYFKLVVKRKDCKDCTYESYSSTCNHDNDPTNCPDNQRNVKLLGTPRLLKLNEEFEVTISGNVINTCGVNFYNTNAPKLTESKFKITGFPFKVHYQPGCQGDCHGWTEIYQQEI